MSKILTGQGASLPGQSRTPRNFPGVPGIKTLLETGTHVVIRVRDGITLHRIGEFLPDGSHLATITGGAALTVRVIEYHVRVVGRDAPELFCLITDLHDHQSYPARTLAAAYHWRWPSGPDRCPHSPWPVP